MRRVLNSWWLTTVTIALLVCVSMPVWAHAIAGQRLFPSTLNFDDAGIGAELPLVWSRTRHHGVTENALDLSVTKPITRNFSLTLESGYSGTTGAGLPAIHGWDNFTLGAVWQVYQNGPTESIGSFSLNHTFAHTGSRATRDDFSTWSPEFDFGQGFGKISTRWLRPLALTGALALDLPSASHAPRMLDWGLSLQYSIPYLQDFVKYVGIHAPFNNLIPLVEFPMQTCLDRGCSGQTTGYAAPGVIWVGRHVQWGMEVGIPMNHRSGHALTVMFGLDFYLDDLAPHSFGAPVFH